MNNRAEFQMIANSIHPRGKRRRLPGCMTSQKPAAARREDYKVPNYVDRIERKPAPPGEDGAAVTRGYYQ